MVGRLGIRIGEKTDSKRYQQQVTGIDTWTKDFLQALRSATLLDEARRVADRARIAPAHALARPTLDVGSQAALASVHAVNKSRRRDLHIGQDVNRGVLALGVRDVEHNIEMFFWSMRQIAL